MARRLREKAELAAATKQRQMREEVDTRKRQADEETRKREALDRNMANHKRFDDHERMKSKHAAEYRKDCSPAALLQDSSGQCALADGSTPTWDGFAITFDE